jgi:hypothetical protein
MSQELLAERADVHPIYVGFFPFSFADLARRIAANPNSPQ